MILSKMLKIRKLIFQKNSPQKTMMIAKCWGIFSIQLNQLLKNTRVGLNSVLQNSTIQGERVLIVLNSVILFKNIINLFLTSGEDQEKLSDLGVCLEIISSQEDRDVINWKERIPISVPKF